MNDPRKVGNYFRERKEVKKIMKEMLKPKFKWTRTVKSQFEKKWKNYWKAYGEHEKFCKSD